MRNHIFEMILDPVSTLIQTKSSTAAEPAALNI